MHGTHVMVDATRRYVVGQFGNPRGLVGRLAGQVMRCRPSNRRRNLWTLELMRVEAGDRILEIGYGPGFALEQLIALARDIEYVGIDRSRMMRDMALARNRAAVAAGKASLLIGSIEGVDAFDLPELRRPFSRVCAINTFMFWQDPVETLRRLRKRMQPGAEIFITHQPRVGDRTDAAALGAGEKIADRLRAAGFGAASVEVCRDLSPVAVCVVGKTS